MCVRMSYIMLIGSNMQTHNVTRWNDKCFRLVYQRSYIIMYLCRIALEKIYIMSGIFSSCFEYIIPFYVIADF